MTINKRRESSQAKSDIRRN